MSTVNPGDVFVYVIGKGTIAQQFLRGSEVRITRPGHRPGDWLGLPLAMPNIEVVIAREELADGRYVRQDP